MVLRSREYNYYAGSSSPNSDQMQVTVAAAAPEPASWSLMAVVGLGATAGFARSLKRARYRHEQPMMTGREMVRQFTPNWFTACMGTGILSLALNQFPVAIPGLHGLALALWLLNILLFVLFAALYLMRWTFHFEGARRIFSHSSLSMFFGAVPMALATIINGFLAFGIPLWGSPAFQIAHFLWWIDVAMSLACGVLIPFLMFTRQEHSLEKMTAIWLLPIVAAEVAAVSGALLAPRISDPQAALFILIVSYALWAYSVPLAMSILGILLFRLALHKFPPPEMAASGWLALGPLGTGALGLILLGSAAPHIFTSVGIAGVGEIAFGVGIIGGLILWGYGVWWLLLAILTTSRYLRRGMPFNLGWWAFTFPLGVYSVATLALARILHSGFLFAAGSALVTALGILWLLVGARTLHGAWQGHLFVSPCLVPGSIPQDRLSQPQTVNR